MKLLPQSSQSSKLGRKSPTISKKKPNYTQQLFLSAMVEKQLVALRDFGVPSSKVLEVLRQLRRDTGAVAKISKRRGRARGRGQSSKQKGRSAVLLVRDLLLVHCQLVDPKVKDDDIFVKATSQGGCDVHLSPRVADIFPFGIEVKNVEKFSLWEALAQAEVNARKRLKPVPGIVFFKRARSPLYVALKADDFLHALHRT